MIRNTYHQDFFYCDRYLKAEKCFITIDQVIQNDKKLYFLSNKSKIKNKACPYVDYSIITTKSFYGFVLASDIS